MSTQQFAITFGTAMSYWFDYAFVGFEGSIGWRYLKNKKLPGVKLTLEEFRLALGLQLIPAIICLVGLLLFIPESPRHLIDKNHYAEALEILAKIRGDGTKTHTAVTMEFYEMKQNISFEHKLFKHHKYRRIFSKGSENNRKRLLLGMAVQIFQQLTGVNAIL